MAEQLDVRLVLETNYVKDAGQWCDLLSEHGVRTVEQFSALTEERLREWGINDSNVYDYALPKAQSLTHEVATSPHHLSTLKQQLLDDALYWACCHGDVVRAQALLSLGANINCHLDRGAGYTPLHISAERGRTEVVAMLLQQPSVDVNSCDEYGDTSLHKAAYEGKLDCVKALLTCRETSLSLRNKYGRTPLDVALRHDVVEYLQQQLAYFCKQEASPPHADEVHNEVTLSTSQLSQKDGKKIYKWEGEGLKLELPANSTATVKLKTVSSVRFELPEGSSQLSPVYWVECEGELNGSSLLELQHCVEVVEETNLSDLMFAVSRVDVDQGSNCKFELREGDFVGSSGKLKIPHFSAWRIGVVARIKSFFGRSLKSLPVLLQVGLYYQKVSSYVYMVNFLAVPKQDAWEKMLLKYFDTNSKYIGSKKTTAVLVGDAVSLQLHTDRGAQELTDDHVVNHWKLKPKEDLMVYREEMLMPSSSDKPHPRDLELRWTGKGTPTPLSQKMVIGGVKGFKWLLMETPSAGTENSSNDEGAETSNPAMMAFKLCYSNIKKALVSHITPVADSSFEQSLIPSTVYTNIISTPTMPSGEKVKILLEAVEKCICDKVEVFAKVLREEGSYLSVIGDDLKNTYHCLLKGEETECNTPAIAKKISLVLREHHKHVIAYIEGTGVISVTNDLFSSEIITEYIYNCVTQNPHTQHASIIALECRLYVTLDHNPEGKLETLLNVFTKVESVGPDVASMIRQKLGIKSSSAIEPALKLAPKPAPKVAPKPAPKPATKPESHSQVAGATRSRRPHIDLRNMAAVPVFPALVKKEEKEDTKF